MNRKLPKIVLTLLCLLSMSACWKDFQAIAKQAREMAGSVVMTEAGRPPSSVPIDTAKHKKRDAIKRCTQLRELEQKAVLIFVDKNARRTSDGLSWMTAYKGVAVGVRAALGKRAEPSNNAKKIYVLVASGTYDFAHEDAELKRAGEPLGLNDSGPLLAFNDPAQSAKMRDIEVIGGYVSNDLCLENDVNAILNSEKNAQRQTILEGQNKSDNVVAFAGDARAKNLALRHLIIKGGQAKVGGAMGGAVSIVSAPNNGISDITLEDVTVEGFSEEDGGCIGIRNGKNIRLDKVKFKICIADRYGGGLAITGAGTEDIKVNDCSFSDVNAGLVAGGGVAVFGTTRTEPLVPMTGPDIFTGARKPRVHFTNTTITNGQGGNLDGQGGGLAIFADAERVKYEGGSISGNASALGSGIALSDRVNYIEFSNVKIENNETSSGIYALNQVKRISFNNCVVRGHNDPLNPGGGISAGDVEGLWLKKMTIEWNTSAQNGGGLNLDGVTNIHIEESMFNNNKALDGGGIAGTEIRGTPVNIINCEFNGNGATQDGGGVSFTRIDDVVLRRSIFKTNRATRYGGHIAVVGITNTLRLENLDLGSTYARHGAGIYAVATRVPADANMLVMDQVKVADAQAENSGGGVYLRHFNDVKITNHESSENRAVAGGDLHITHTRRVLVQNSRFKGSKADSGSIFIQNVSNANLRDVRVNDSRARNGGGLYVQSVINLGLDNVEMNRNIAAGDGGGAFMENITNLTIAGGIIKGGTARDGGGIYAKAVSNLSIENFQASANSASQDGGSVYIETVDNARINGVDILNSHAARDGGGMFAKAVSNISLDFVMVGHNSAAQNGGNAYIGDLKKELTVISSTIAHGSAKLNAGGLYVQATGGRLELYRTRIMSNKVDGQGVCQGAAGVYGDGLGKVVLKFSDFLDNTVEYPAAGSNCAAAMKLINLTPQDNAFIIDWTEGKLRVERNKVIGADDADILGNNITGNMFIPGLVQTVPSRNVTLPAVQPIQNNRPFIVQGNTPLPPRVAVDVYGLDHRNVVVTSYD